MEIGKTMKFVVMVYLLQRMVQCIKDSDKIIYNMDKEKKLQLMVLFMRDNLKTVLNKVKES